VKLPLVLHVYKDLPTAPDGQVTKQLLPIPVVEHWLMLYFEASGKPVEHTFSVQVGAVPVKPALPQVNTAEATWKLALHEIVHVDPTVVPAQVLES